MIPSWALLGLMLLWSVALKAQDVGVYLGLRSDSADSQVPGASVAAKVTPSVGVLGFFPLGEKSVFKVRGGLSYVQRQYGWEIAGTTNELRFSYFEVPVGLLYQFHELGGVFVGASVGFLLEKKCLVLGPSCQKTSGNFSALQLGASFKVAPQLGLEAYFEQGLVTIVPELKNHRAVGVNALLMFD